jgi:hypothetical protein
VFEVSIQITGFVSDDFPGFVSCDLIDAHGRVWTFVEKVPVVTAAALSRDSSYPQLGQIRCDVLRESSDAAGSLIFRVDTSMPDGVETTDGTHEFDVYAHQVTRRAVGV